MSSARRRIAVVTVGRSDYGIYRPILAALGARNDVEYGLVVGGAHLVSQYGSGVEAIIADGHQIIDSVDMTMASDASKTTALSMGLGVIGFARAFASWQPDIVVLLGDRFETFAAASAAVPFGTPLLHIHGGDLSEGAMDERFRHAITKLSHLHCVATALSGARVRQMGEEEWRIHVTGAPGLDAALWAPRLDRPGFFAQLGITDPGPFLLATYHPVTTEPDPEGRQIDEVLAAINEVGYPVLFTTANADPGGQLINERIRAAALAAPQRVFVAANLGALYASAMTHAAAMIGNSSSGIIEACSYGLPVLNVGPRQAGRERSANVTDCDCRCDAIVLALRAMLSDAGRSAARAAHNVYGDGRAGPRIAAIAADTPLDERLRVKRFAMLSPQKGA